MKNVWNIFWYYILTGICAFVIGRVVPKEWFRADRFPFQGYAFEENGEIYKKLKIQRWQGKVPDMSKICPWLMPPKSLAGDFKQRLPVMIQETCMAEFIHLLLCVTGLYTMKLYPGIGGFLLYLIYILIFNLPFILIQRYNRPRLLRVWQKLQRSASA